MKRKKNLHFTNFFLLSGAWEGISFESEIILIAKIKKKTLKKTCLIICLWKKSMNLESFEWISVLI